MDDLTKKIAITAAVIILSIPLLFGVYKLTSQPQKAATPIDLQVTAKDWITGNKQAKNVLVEYGDFQCPACGVAYPYVKELLKKHNNIAFVFRHFPLSQHKNAIPAAMAAEAAGQQNKFWEMEDLLYTKQNDWAEKANAEEIFISYAKQLKLNEAQFKKDLSNNALKQKIADQQNSGNAVRIQATPTFYLNGVQIETQSLLNIDSLLK